MDSPFEGTWMQDVENDYHKAVAIMEKQHTLYLRLLAAINNGDRRTAISVTEDLIIGHNMLKELWSIDNKQSVRLT